MIQLNYDYNYSVQRNKDTIDTINKHFPYKTFKVFFNEENYLLTKYRNMEEYSASAILESYDKNILLVRQCNCGYRGHGSRNTIELLGLLGVPEDISTEYVTTYNAVELYFDETGKLTESRTNLFGLFESRPNKLQRGQINLNNIDFFSISERKFYFLNPIGEQIFTLLQLIKVAEPTKFIYFIGRDNRQFIDIGFNPSASRLKHKLTQHFHCSIEECKFAVVKGINFDVVCFLPNSVAKTFINMLCMSLGIVYPFSEVSILGIDFMVEASEKIYSAMDKLKYLCSVFKRTSDNKQEYFEIPLERTEVNYD